MSEQAAEPTYAVRLAAVACRQVERLEESEAAAVFEALSRLRSVPERQGGALSFELQGCWAMRRGPFRAIYRVDDEQLTVEVLRIGHRRDLYRSV